MVMENLFSTGQWVYFVRAAKEQGRTSSRHAHMRVVKNVFGYVTLQCMHDDKGAYYVLTTYTRGKKELVCSISKDELLNLLMKAHEHTLAMYILEAEAD
jgi:hypothetical protein